MQQVAQCVAATNHDKSLTPQQNLSSQHVAQVQSDLIFCDLLRRQGFSQKFLLEAISRCDVSPRPDGLLQFVAKCVPNSASFPVVLGDFGCDVTCQACRENSPRTLALALGSKPPLATRIARTGLGTRLKKSVFTEFTSRYHI